MKKLVLAALVAAIFAPAVSAQVKVKGYTRSDGTYVAPHYRSSPNSSTLDNYSTKGNVNPYTGTYGTRNPSPSYGSPYTTPRSPSTSTFGSPYPIYGK